MFFKPTLDSHPNKILKYATVEFNRIYFTEFWLKHGSTLKLLVLQARNADPNQDTPAVLGSSLPPHFILEDVLSSTSTSTVDLLDISSGEESSQHSTSALSSDDDGDGDSIDDTLIASDQHAVFNKFALLACEDSD